MSTRFVAAAAVLATSASLLAGCSSSHPSHSARSQSASSQTSGATRTGGATGGSSATGASADATALAVQLGTALDALTSAHLSIDAGTLGGTSTADVKLTDGHSSATEVHLSVGGQPVEVVTVGSISYVKLPKPQNPAKPWMAITPDSSNSVVKSLANGFSVASLTSSLSAIGGLVKSSSQLQDKGVEQIDGVSATHYAMQLTPSQGTGNAQLDGLLALLGKTKLPVDVWLDSKHRPLKLVIDVALAGSSFPITVRMSDFDAPVTITAPPASQVSGR